MSRKLTIEERVEAEHQLAGRLGRYKGEWVAVRDHEIMDHARTLQARLDSQKRFPPEKRGYIFRVTSHKLRI